MSMPTNARGLPTRILEYETAVTSIDELQHIDEVETGILDIDEVVATSIDELRQGY